MPWPERGAICDGGKMLDAAVGGGGMLCANVLDESIADELLCESDGLT